MPHDRAQWRCSWRLEKWNKDKIDWAQSEAGVWTRLRALRPSQRGYLTRFVGGEAGSVLMRRLGLEPDEARLVEENLLMNEGITAMWGLITATGGNTAYSNANARVGVGDSTTAEAATQTDLQAATNKLYKAMNASFPSVTAQTVQFQSDFSTSEANFAWNEWTVDNGSAAAKNLNRKVQALGTKPNTQTWTMTASITLG